jgi:3-methyladenine DNA glycosylase AlkD
LTPASAKTLAQRIESELRSVGTPERAAGSKRYLKSDLDFVGTTLPDIRRVVKEILKENRLDRVALLALVEALWSKPVFERRMSAEILLEQRVGLLEEHDIDVLERLLRASLTWALVDGLAVNVVGPLVERFDSLNATLDRWAKDDDFWIRRSALLALLGPLRRGEGDWDRFASYADDMLEEKEFFIRKAIGWILRETSKKRPDLVYDWIAPRAQRASGVTMRETVKYLSGNQRNHLIDLRKRN